MKITKRRLIFKVSTERLRKAKWNLTLSLDEALNNNELIALGDSQTIRWIDELNGTPDIEQEMHAIRSSIRALAKQDDSVANRHAVKALHARLNQLLFLPDYVHIVVGKNSEYVRAVKGFRINGIRFRRLVGTNGGLKNSTVVFVNERIVEELRARIRNGHNPEAKFVPGKYEAYRALPCSGSVPVSMPNGIIVVDDCRTTFREDIIMLNDDGRTEPLMTLEDNYEVELDESDGYGLMSPALAQRWSDELHLGYMASGLCLRYSFTKGMAFPFDFVEFAEVVAGKYEVTDAWGDVRDVRNAELILTTSQLKLWDAYPNMEDYLAHCEENKYTFAVTKTAPETLESRRNLNYQFIQGYHLTDEQITELVTPTIQEIRDVLTGDYRKALIFLCGRGLNDKNIHSFQHGFAGAMMANPEMFKDPYIKRCIYDMIRKRIDDAKIGVIGVHGNYSVIGGDPYALCQHMFGLEVTGLLKAGEIWNKYWLDAGAPDVVACRAPMSAINNIRKRHLADGEDVRYWFRYITTCTLLNAWDTCRAAANGADCDGDLFFLTDNRVMLENLPDTKTIMCIQRSATKYVPTEDVLIASNLASFGDDIGKTTNKVTAMYDVQSLYEPGSPEYETLDYRIMSGQLYQQNCIDKIKGIVCNPMPRFWFDYHANAAQEDCTEEDEARRDFNLRILAEKKPYFMRYIYPTLMNQYKTYMKNVETKCAREFRLSLDELLAIPEAEMTDAQKDFVRYYRRRLPVGNNNCVMNKICRIFEKEFDGRMKTWCEEPFDYSIMKSGAEYTRSKYDRLKTLYEMHREWLSEYRRRSKYERVDAGEKFEAADQNWFRQRCLEVCSSAAEMCDIILDLCYRHSGTKSFAWEMCGSYINENLARAAGGKILYPALDANGDIEYGGARFSMKEADWTYTDTEAELFDGDHSEREGLGEEGD